MIFLRPWGFLMLLLPILWYVHKKYQSVDSPWKRIIDKPLFDALRVRPKTSLKKQKRTRWIFILWLIWTIALVGPAWNKQTVPATISQPNTVLVVDLKPDLESNTLKQLQMRLYDILDLLKGHRVALVLFGTNEGYTAMPLTPDVGLIQQLAPDLFPSDLPEEAQNAQEGIKEAEQLLDRSGGKGEIIFLTSDPEQKVTSKYSTYMLHLNESLDTLVSQLKNEDTIQINEKAFAEIWSDMGIYFVLLSLPIFLFCFRKNVLYLLLILFIPSAHAHFFMRPDQEDYQNTQQAIKAYRSKDYENAARLFSDPYNQGNALAYMGQIEQAITSYQRALQENPQNEDARFNKEYLEKQMPPKEKSKSDQNSKQEDTKDQGQQKDQSTSDQEKQDNGDKTQKNEQSTETQEKEEHKEDLKETTQEQTLQDLEQALQEQPSEEPFNQKEQQILNRLNRDPGRVLRYRLNLQHQRKRL